MKNENKLVTTGAYAWVRNPIYSAISLMLTGTLILQKNNFHVIIIENNFQVYA